MESRALGRGLSALIPEKNNTIKNENISIVKLSEVSENSLQPRINYDDAKLSELISSIKEKGILQPILVRPKGAGFEVVAGERRLKAARILKLENIPVVVKNVDDQEALVLALVENIQREELNPIEEAKAFRRLINDFNFTQDSVAQSVGKDRSTISNLLRLLKLPEEVQKSLFDGVLSVGHARALLSIENKEEQKKIFSYIVKERLSVREVENLVKQSSSADKLTTKTSTKSFKQAYLITIEEELQKILGTKVRIISKTKRGKIIVEYYSPEDLERIRTIIAK